MNENTPSENVVSSADSKSHFLKNTVSNIVFFLFNAGTSIYFVPFQIFHLGIANYGMITLGTSFMQYAQIVGIGLVGTVFRFVTVSLAKGDRDAASSYLNTQIQATLLISLVFYPLCLLFSFASPHIVEIPAGQERNTQVLFALIFTSFFLSLFCQPFRVGTFVRQRFDIRNYLEISNQFFRYGSWLVLFAVFIPSLPLIGIGYVFGGLVALVGSAYAHRYLLPEVKIRFGHMDREKLREMFTMGFWVMVSQLGVVLYLMVDLLIINKTIGPASSGKYATVLGLAIMLRSLSSMMTSLVVPMAVACYARQDYAGLLRNTVRAEKFVSIGMAGVLGILCGLSKPFMSIWLGEEYAYLNPLFWLLLSHNVINNGVEPIFSVFTAANRVAPQGMATVAGGVLKVALALILIKYTTLGFYGVALATMVALLTKNLIFTPMFAARVLNSSPWPFIKALIPGIIIFAFTASIGLIAAKYMNIESILVLIAVASVIFIVYITAAYVFAIRGDDRAFLHSLLKRRQSK